MEKVIKKSKLEFMDEILKKITADREFKLKNAVNVFNIPTRLFDRCLTYHKLENNFSDTSLKPGMYDFENDCSVFELFKQSKKTPIKYLIILAYYPHTFIVELDEYLSLKDAVKMAGLWLSQPIDKEYYELIEDKLDLPFEKVKGKTREKYMSHHFYEGYSEEGEYIEFEFGS